MGPVPALLDALAETISAVAIDPAVYTRHTLDCAFEQVNVEWHARITAPVVHDGLFSVVEADAGLKARTVRHRDFIPIAQRKIICGTELRDEGSYGGRIDVCYALTLRRDAFLAVVKDRAVASHFNIERRTPAEAEPARQRNAKRLPITDL